MITLGGRTRSDEDKSLSCECGYMVKMLLNTLAYYVCVIAVPFLAFGFHRIACEVTIGISMLYMIYFEMSESKKSEVLIFFTILQSIAQITFIILWLNQVLSVLYAVWFSFVSFVCMFFGWFAVKASQYHEDHDQIDDTRYTDVFLEEIGQGIKRWRKNYLHNTFAAFLLFLLICGFTIWLICHIFFIQLANWLSNIN